MPLIVPKQLTPGTNGFVIRTVAGVPVWDQFLHALTHVDGGADEINGDLIDITWNPTNYTPDATPSEANDVDDLTAHLAGIDTVLGTLGGSFATFFAMNGNDDISNYATDVIGSNSTDYITGRVPLAATTISKIAVVLIPATTATGLNIDFAVSYAANGEDITTHSGADTTSTYNFTANEFTEIDLIAIFGSISGGDFFGIEVDHQSIGQNVHYLGVLVEFTV